MVSRYTLYGFLMVILNSSLDASPRLFSHLRRALNAALSALARATKRQRCLQLLRDGGGINLISCLASRSPGIFMGIFHGFMPWLAFKRTILWH